MCASTLCPFSSSTRNIALGSGSTTVPSTRIVSSLGFARMHHLRSAARRKRVERPRGRPTRIHAGHEGRKFLLERSPRHGEHLGPIFAYGDRVLEVGRAPP